MRLPRKLRQIRRNAGRRALVFGSLVAFVVASVGFPMPRLGDLSSKPYPCQGHACGCHDADACWRHCCCYDKEQKLAWAKAHNVAPPLWLLAEADPSSDKESAEHGHAKHEHSAAADPSDRHADPCEAPVASCCQKRHKKASASPQTRPAESASQTDVASRSVAAESSNTTTTTAGWQLVTAANYGQCHGGQSLWTVCSIAPAPPVATYRFEWFVIERLAASSQRAESAFQPPPTPPPRCC